MRVGLRDADLDLQRSLLAIDLRIQLDDLRPVAELRVGVRHDLGVLPHAHVAEVGLADVELRAELREVR